MMAYNHRPDSSYRQNTPAQYYPLQPALASGMLARTCTTTTTTTTRTMTYDSPVSRATAHSEPVYHFEPTEVTHPPAHYSAGQHNGCSAHAQHIQGLGGGPMDTRPDPDHSQLLPVHHGQDQVTDFDRVHVEGETWHFDRSHARTNRRQTYSGPTLVGIWGGDVIPGANEHANAGIQRTCNCMHTALMPSSCRSNPCKYGHGVPDREQQFAFTVDVSKLVSH
ncbi:hypothetical protein BDZ91DRAFT_71010 [Kalaharituber pfeilii]|nr:hypothetical protein BDZ91DRAFT_71010 [Kalaharituber pfeilii]